MSVNPSETFVERVVRELAAFGGLRRKHRGIAFIVVVVFIVIAFPQLKEISGAIFSPNEDQPVRSLAQTDQSAIPLSAEPPQNLTKRSDAVGLWKVVFDIEDHDALYWRLYEDGSHDGLGTWMVNRDYFQLTYSNGLLWSGSIKSNLITGTVDYGNRNTQAFKALKIHADPSFPVVSYSACFVDNDIQCINTEVTQCRATTGPSFSIKSECIRHCRQEALDRKVRCLH